MFDCSVEDQILGGNRLRSKSRSAVSHDCSDDINSGLSRHREGVFLKKIELEFVPTLPFTKFTSLLGRL